jgi:hypothetical protein
MKEKTKLGVERVVVFLVLQGRRTQIRGYDVQMYVTITSSAELATRTVVQAYFMDGTA